MEPRSALTGAMIDMLNLQFELEETAVALRVEYFKDIEEGATVREWSKLPEIDRVGWLRCAQWVLTREGRRRRVADEPQP